MPGINDRKPLIHCIQSVVMTDISSNINLCSARKRLTDHALSGSGANRRFFYLRFLFSKQPYMRKLKRFFHKLTALLCCQFHFKLANTADSVRYAVHTACLLQSHLILKMQTGTRKFRHLCCIVIRMHRIMCNPILCQHQYFSSMHRPVIDLTDAREQKRMMRQQKIRMPRDAFLNDFVRRIQRNKHFFYFLPAASNLQSRIIPVHRKRPRKFQIQFFYDRFDFHFNFLPLPLL